MTVFLLFDGLALLQADMYYTHKTHLKRAFLLTDKHKHRYNCCEYGMLINNNDLFNSNVCRVRMRMCIREIVNRDSCSTQGVQESNKKEQYV